MWHQVSLNGTHSLSSYFQVQDGMKPRKCYETKRSLLIRHCWRKPRPDQSLKGHPSVEKLAVLFGKRTCVQHSTFGFCCSFSPPGSEEGTAAAAATTTTTSAASSSTPIPTSGGRWWGWMVCRLETSKKKPTKSIDLGNHAPSARGRIARLLDYLVQ